MLRGRCTSVAVIPGASQRICFHFQTRTTRTVRIPALKKKLLQSRENSKWYLSSDFCCKTYLMMILKIRIAYIFLKLQKKTVLEPILLAISLCFTKETILMLSFSQQKVTYLMTFHGFGVLGTNFTRYFRHTEWKHSDRDLMRVLQSLWTILLGGSKVVGMFWSAQTGPNNFWFFGNK